MKSVPLLPKVEYEFCVEGKAADGLRTRRFSSKESLSNPYFVDIDLETDETDYAWRKLLGTKCTLRLRRDSWNRNFHGIVQRVELVTSSREHCSLTVRLVPALALAAMTVDSKIFQDQSVPTILRAVLNKCLGQHRRPFRMDLFSSYQSRVYCVQFRESTFDFLSRLMEQAGIGYYFDHRAEHAETLVLFDQTPKLPGIDSFQGNAELRWVSTNPDDIHEESVQHFRPAQEMTSNHFAQLDFDFQAPEIPVRFMAEGANPRDKTFEVYQHGERRFDYPDQGQRSAYARDSTAWPAKQGSGLSNATGLTPGHTFELIDLEGLLSAKYLITEVHHQGDCPEATRLGVDAKSPKKSQYDNSFRAMTADTIYRPAITTPRPKVYGPLTGTVVGPSGEEIYTDELGRIKVFMHWDRVNLRSNGASCWIRVAQTWAGNGFGSFVLPRIGMEVIVEFMDGDPDQPLVVGCVYNGKNGVPYDLPQHCTRTTFKTRSTPLGDGFNELRFEDSKGHEEVFLHAERDQNIVVGRNQTRNVGEDDELSVGHDRYISIGNDQSRDVGANDSLTVGGNRSVLVNKNSTEIVELMSSETVGVSKSMHVEVNYDEFVGANKTVTVVKDCSEEVGGHSSTAIGKTHKLDVGDTSTITIAKDLAASVNTKATFTVTDEITIKCGKTTVNIKKNGDVAIAASNIHVKASGDITMKGAKIKLN